MKYLCRNQACLSDARNLQEGSAPSGEIDSIIRSFGRLERAGAIADSVDAERVCVYD